MALVQPFRYIRHTYDIQMYEWLELKISGKVKCFFHFFYRNKDVKYVKGCSEKYMKPTVVNKGSRVSSS